MTASLSRRRFLQSTLAAGLGVGSLPAFAASGRMLLGFLPTNLTSAVFEAFLREMQFVYKPDLGSRLVHVPGNAGGLALDQLKKAPADGGTVLLSPSSIMTLLPNLRNAPGGDPVDDLIPVGACAQFTYGFLVGPGVPASVTSMVGYVQWLRQNPGSGECGVVGLGTGSHFIVADLTKTADLPLKPVAYKGSMSQIEDMAAGSVPSAVVTLGSARNAAKMDGNIRLLAATSATRWPLFADLPTLMELKLASTAGVESAGCHLAAGTPAAKVRELADAIAQVVQTASVRKAFDDAAMRPPEAGVADYPAAIARERAAWADTIRRTDFRISG